MGFSNIRKKENNKVKKVLSGIKNNTKDVYTSTSGKFFNSSPIFVTYYSTNTKLTTVGIGFKDVYEEIGSESPVRYGKVKDFVLYNIPTITSDEENDDSVGIQTIVDETEAIVLPGTITPLEGDRFIMNDVLFRVVKASPTLFKNKPYIKISFTYDETVSSDNDAIAMLNKQVVNEYTFIYENVGTTINPILTDSDLDKLNELELSRSKLNDLYMDVFYDKYTDTLLCKDIQFNGDNVYSPVINAVQKEFGIMKYNRNTFIVTPDTTADSLYDNRKLNYSILYKYIKNGEIDDIVDDKLLIGLETKLFTYHENKGSKLVYSDNSTHMVIDERHGLDINKLDGNDFSTHILEYDMTDTLYSDTRNIINKDNIDIIKYIDYVNNLEYISNDYFHYTYVPLILFNIDMLILKRFKNNI